MEAMGVVAAILLWLIGLLVLVAIIRYAVDTSKTSRRMSDLLNEGSQLRAEVARLKEKDRYIDERI